MTKISPYRRVFFSPGALEAGEVSRHLRAFAKDLSSSTSPEADLDLVVVMASEVLRDPRCLPAWVGVKTVYLLITDLPEPAVLRFPTIFGLHKPDQRMHVTRDPGAVRRMLISLARDHTWEGIVDAYVLPGRLVAVLGDFRILEVPQARLPVVRKLDADRFAGFEIDHSGSFLHWADGDVHLGPSQMLQAVDPMHLADVEIERYRRSKISSALALMRESAQLRQTDILGLSERHVRRLEKEESRLTVPAAERYAESLNLSLSEFLRELSRTISELRDDAEAHDQVSQSTDVGAG